MLTCPPGTAKGAIGYPSTPYPTPLNPPILEELTETTPEQTIIFTVSTICVLETTERNPY